MRVSGWRITDLGNTGPRIGVARLSMSRRAELRSDTRSTSLGSTTTGEPFGDFRSSSNDDWIGFGREILAVLDGTAHAARDGIVDNQPLVEPPRPSSPSAADTYRNCVIIRAGDGAFVHYAHLQRNSVAVKVGGSGYRRGHVIGRLGNSGNTNGAHLHFNITDGPEPEATQGIPFVFDTVKSSAAQRQPLLWAPNRQRARLGSPPRRSKGFCLSTERSCVSDDWAAKQRGSLAGADAHRVGRSRVDHAKKGEAPKAHHGTLRSADISGPAGEMWRIAKPWACRPPSASSSWAEAHGSRS